MIDPIWIIVGGAWLVGVLCGLAWNEARVEQARSAAYQQGHEDTVALAKQAVAREMGHETQTVISIAAVIAAAEERMHQ